MVLCYSNRRKPVLMLTMEKLSPHMRMTATSNRVYTTSVQSQQEETGSLVAGHSST